MFPRPVVSGLGLAALLLLLLAAPHLARAAAPVSVIPVTGQLLIGGSPATGNYDLQFQLYSAATGGTAFGPLVTVTNVAVEDGVFYAEVDFGNLNYGNPLYVQTSYRRAGTGTYTALTPRHVAPTAIYAANANYASASGNTYRLQGTTVSATAPTANQVLTYTGGQWAPATPASGGTYTAGTGLTLSANKFSVSVPLALGGSNSSPILSATNSGSGAGVTGTNSGNGDYGFLGGSDPKYGDPVGVFGSDTSLAGTNGVFGLSTNGTGTAGVSTGGFGVYGNSMSSDGIQGQTADSGHSGVAGVNAGSGNGVFGVSRSSGDSGFLGGTDPHFTAPAGVFGNDVASSGGNGVLGVSAYATGVYGLNTNTGDYGFLGGAATRGNNNFAVGVFGDDSGGSGDGVYGVSANGSGVEGDSTGSDGVYGISANGNGVEGYSSANGNGVEGYSSGSGYAGEFGGNVNVTGTLTAGAKNFKIDHPLDPAHKYLSHASVESNEMKDIYDGVVTTDAGGNAAVTLPNWFGALNGDFRYQLTCIGQFAQAIVATEIQNNQFTIKTDKPNVKVSWQVTGVRHDAFALAHPLQVEQEKPANEQGLYQNPDAFGLPDSMGLGAAKRRGLPVRTP